MDSNPTQYGRYQILNELGIGQFAKVYRAYDPEMERVVALKVLRHDRVISEELVERFRKEPKAIVRLSHTGIVAAYDVGHDHGTYYIAMEFLEGIPLDGVIREKRLSIKEVVDLGVQVAEALDYAHQNGIVHRDIKPSNIILTTSGKAKITDFGIARIEDSLATQQTQAGEILGTPSYMSPEQVLGHRVDGRSDLYSLGVILYELTTGVRPFRGDSMAAIFRAITAETPLAPSKAESSVSPALSGLVMKSLEKDPDRRFQTGKAMAEALKACPTEEEQTPSPQPPIKEKSKRSVYFVLAALIIIGLAGGLIYHFLKVREEPWLAEIVPIPFDIDLLKAADAPIAEKVLQALLKVDSVPSGAQVFLDDAAKGETPLKLELPVGKYEVRINLHDYHEWVAQLQLDEEGEVPLLIPLIPLSEGGP